MKNYYMIVDGEDGISVSEALTKQQVLTRVEEDYYGDVYWSTCVPKMGDGQFDRPVNVVMDSEASVGFIIKGNVLKPRPLTTVLKYQLD